MIGNDQFLKQIFAEKDELAKANKEGGKFGFVRYKNVRNIGDLLLKLDDIWLGSYKIRCKVARFACELPTAAGERSNLKISTKLFLHLKPGLEERR